MKRLPAFILAALIVFTMTTRLTAADADAAKPLRHVVALKFKPEATPEQVQELLAAFAGLADRIPQIHSLEWGENNSPEGLNKELTHCFIVSFRNAADRDAYLPHPAHQAFVETYGPLIADVFVIDIQAD